MRATRGLLHRRLVLATLALMLAAVAAAGGGGRDDHAGDSTATSSGGTSDLSGTIQVDGSSTVGPLTTAAAERFQESNGGVQIPVGVAGPGGGFERFCAGETALSDASRPIEDDEKAKCADKGIEPVEFQVAND